MNKTVSRFAALLMASIVFTACPKKPNDPPVADTELQSSVDVSWATFVISDIQQMCGAIGERSENDHFYEHVPGTPPVNQAEGNYDTAQTRIMLNFRQTPCLDEKKRRGEVRLDVLSSFQQNAGYYHSAGFNGALHLLDYGINDWVISVEDGAILKNNLTTNQWDPRKTNLSWTLSGKFHFELPGHPERGITWDGTLTQVLTNTSDNAVYSATRFPAITWSLATVGFYGKASGLVSGNKPYTLNVSEKEMLVRDMTCSPDLLGVQVTDSDIQPQRSEFHPFSKGIATVEIQGSYPRRVYYGNESNSSGAAQCDNTGEVLIKGLLYKVNFEK